MRRLGIFSFLHYLFYLVTGFGILYILSSAVPSAGGVQEGEFNESPAVLLVLIAFPLIAYGLVGVILKLLHFATRFALWPILCILLDFRAISGWIGAGTIIYDLFAEMINPALLIGILAIPVVFVILSTIDNLRSIAR